MLRHTLFSIILLSFICACSTSPTTNHQVATATAHKTGGKEPSDGDYWALRISYPTMQYDSRWLQLAKLQHDAIPASKPRNMVRNTFVPGNGLKLNPNQFTSLGPQPLNGQFGPAAGRVNVIVPHPSNTSIAFIGTDGGGVWRTMNCCDANTSWQALNDDPLFNSIAIGDLVLDPNNPDIIYAGTGDLRYGSYSFGSAGLLRSEDGGDSWEVLGAEEFSPVRPQAVGEFPQYQAIGKVRVNPRNSSQIAVGTKTGLFFSDDSGLNWDGPCLTNNFTNQRQDTTGLEVWDNGVSTDITVAIGTRGHNTTVQPDLDQNGANGIYRSSWPNTGCPLNWILSSRPDNGWPAGTGQGTPFPINSVGRIDLAIAPDDGNIIYAQLADVNTRGVRGVWRTLDGGSNWEQRATAAEISGCDDSGNQAWYDMGMTVDPNDSNRIFLSAVDLFLSTNGADSFTNATCGYSGGAQVGDDVHVDHHARAFVGGDSSQLLIGSDGGMYYAANANINDPRQISFQHLNDSLSTIEFYSGDITANFATSSFRGAVAGAQDNGSSVALWDGIPVEPVTWNGVFGGDGIYARIEPVNGQRWYVESQRGNLGISQNGPSGPYLGVSEPWINDRRAFLFPFEIDKYNCEPSGCNRLIAGSYRVWETINGGINGADWLSNSPDLTKGVLADRSIINQLSYAVSDGRIAIAGTNDGNVWLGFGMGQGVADSATWVDVTDNNTVLPNRPILDVATDPQTATIAYAAVGGFMQNTPTTPGHVYQLTCDSNCGSFQWLDKSGNLPNIPVNSIIVNALDRRMVFAGTDWGLYFTNNIEAENPTWMRFNDGLPSVMIWDMAIDRGFTTLAVFTRSRGAFVLPLPNDPDLLFSNGFE